MNNKIKMSGANEKLLQTPSQTAGPFFAYGLTPEQYQYDFTSIADGGLADEKNGAALITIAGQVFDGEDQPISDALIEIWQADADGNYHTQYHNIPISPYHFTGFGRMGTGANTETGFTFQTIKPGSAEGQAPHVNVIVFMRGLLTHAYTRIYFSDEVAANSKDIVLNSVEEKRRDTLISQLTATAEGHPVYKFDIHMQGGKETVFFDV